MTVAASSIIDRVRIQLIDLGSQKRWDDSELLKWLSDGQRTICEINPASTITRATVSLVAGTRQALPADANMLLNVIRNMNSDLLTAGRAVRAAAMDLMDTYNPSWHTDTPNRVVQNFVYDIDERWTFYVYPPNDGAGKVELTYSINPEELTALTDNIIVRDNYQTALFDYVMFRALQKDSDFAAGTQQAAVYLSLFNATMGFTEAGTAQQNPANTLQPNGEADG